MSGGLLLMSMLMLMSMAYWRRRMVRLLMRRLILKFLGPLMMLMHVALGMAADRR